MGLQPALPSLPYPAELNVAPMGSFGGTRNVAQWVECSPNMHDPPPLHKAGCGGICLKRTCEAEAGESEVQNHPCLHRESEPSRARDPVSNISNQGR